MTTPPTATMPEMPEAVAVVIYHDGRLGFAGRHSPWPDGSHNLYTAAQLRAYAEAALALRREDAREDVPQEWRMFVAGRYPYTYAYDLMRERRPLPDDELGDNNSRAAMSAHLTKFCEERGINKLALCERLADIYVRHYQAIERAEAARDAAIDAAIGGKDA